MKARIMRTKTDNRSRTYVVTLALSPLEADRVLTDCETATERNRATQALFKIIEAIADEDGTEIAFFNSGAYDNAYADAARPLGAPGQKPVRDHVGSPDGSRRPNQAGVGGSHSGVHQSLPTQP